MSEPASATTAPVSSPTIGAAAYGPAIGAAVCGPGSAGTGPGGWENKLASQNMAGRVFGPGGARSAAVPAPTGATTASVSAPAIGTAAYGPAGASASGPGGARSASVSVRIAGGCARRKDCFQKKFAMKTS